MFGYGFVTYWEQAKAKLVGVDPAVIEQYNVVSAPVSYTHLVQELLRAQVGTETGLGDGVVGQRQAQLGGCLLYTSRCV